jgi:hypothetical protein
MIELKILNREVVEVDAVMNSDCYNSRMIFRKNGRYSDIEALYAIESA